MRSIIVAVLNIFNDLLHAEPVSIVADCVFWLVILLVGFPLAAVVVFIRMIWQVISFFAGRKNIIDPKQTNKQDLAVFITGCDSGFGRELVAPLTARGFTVFCGCLHTSSFQHFKDDSLAIPIQIDVTSDKSVADAYKFVSTWLAGGSKRKRYFHALVNNAGVFRMGLIDWAKMNDFKATMDVNYFGIIRCVKEFMPIFKKQAATASYSDARIINMTSMAGMFLGGDCFTPYVASKHAADALTDCLRLEMIPFGVHVTCINPTFHGTPMANLRTLDLSIGKVWDALSSTVRDDYGKGELGQYLVLVFGNRTGHVASLRFRGERLTLFPHCRFPGYLQAVRNIFAPLKYVTWQSRNVVKAMEDSIVDKVPPCRELVGMDAKYVFAPLRLLKSGIGIAAIRDTPAIMK
jgi:NAD(P)-dependent dehydrogenase (short-subunit alcohol dehydrogenase family)